MRSDGSDLRLLSTAGSQAAWSPDGSRIAIYESETTLYTVSTDGTDLLVLLKSDTSGNLFVPNPEGKENP